MKISWDDPITHGDKPGKTLYLIGVGSACAPKAKGGVLYNYIIFADSSEDAIIKFKLNLARFDTVLKQKFKENPDAYYWDSDKPEKMLEEIEKGWFSVQVVDTDRAIPVSYFDDSRSNY